MKERRDGVAQVAGRRYWREEDARIVVEAWRGSGLTLVAFARRQGVHAKRLGRWARRLRAVRREPVTFHPVQLVAPERADAAAEATIEVVLSDGCTIRVLRGFAAEDLRQVLAVLEGRRRC